MGVDERDERAGASASGDNDASERGGETGQPDPVVAQTVRDYYIFATNRDEHNGWMDGCIVWWRAGGKGYSYDLNDAGLFSEEQRLAGYAEGCTWVPREIVDANSYSPRLAFWSRGRGGGRAICEMLKEALKPPQAPEPSHAPASN